MKRITTVYSGTGTYEICNNEHGYWAIEHEYLDSDGRLSKQINGIQGGLSRTLSEAIKTAIFRGKCKEYKENNPTASDQEFLEFMARAIAER